MLFFPLPQKFFHFFLATALGVNLPAHLVIIKSTTQIGSRSSQEYSVAQVLQMIGRAGRPQFDESATAVIMTNANLVVIINDAFPLGI